MFSCVCGRYSKEKAKGLLGSCPRDAGTRGTFLARLLAGKHPQTNQPLPASSSRPVFPDDSVARVCARLRIHGTQPPGAGSDFVCLSSAPSTGDLDQTLLGCGLATDLSVAVPCDVSLSQSLDAAFMADN